MAEIWLLEVVQLQLFITTYKHSTGRTIILQLKVKIWVPPLGFDPHCGGKLLPLQNEFTPSMKPKKKIHKSYEQILKNQIIQFSRKRLNRS